MLHIVCHKQMYIDVPEAVKREIPGAAKRSLNIYIYIYIYVCIYIYIYINP